VFVVSIEGVVIAPSSTARAGQLLRLRQL
jgi:hypothetical protein